MAKKKCKRPKSKKLPKFALGGNTYGLNYSFDPHQTSAVQQGMAMGVQNYGAIPSNMNAQSAQLQQTDIAQAVAANPSNNMQGANQGAGAVGKMGPVGGIIGTAWGIGNKIGQADLNKNMQFDKQGNLKDETALRNTYVRGSFFDPAGTGIRAMQDPDASALEKVGSFMGFGAAFAGKKAKRAEKEAKKVAWKNQINQAIADYSGEGNQRYMSIMANGGTIKNVPYESVTTPIYKPVTSRTVYLEGTKNNLIPEGVKFKDFAKDPTPYIKGLGNAYKYDPKLRTGTVSGFTKRFEDVQTGVTGKQLGQKGQLTKFPNGGTVKDNYTPSPFVDKLMTGNEYAKRIGNLDSFLWDQYLGGGTEGFENWTDEQKEIYIARRGLLDDVPSTMPEIRKGSNVNEMKYLNSLMQRLEPHMTQENAELLGKSNLNPFNIKKKIDLVKDLPYYKADLDSLQKYAPEFYEDYNLQMAKPFLKEGDIPEYTPEIPQYPMGGLIPYEGEEANAEVEGGETAVLPNGQDVAFEGPSHAEGGIDINAPEGTRIYSDRLKPKGSKNTFSDLNKKILGSINKQEKILSDPSSSKVARATAERNMAKLKGEQEDLFISQERMKIPKNVFGAKKFGDGGEVTYANIRNLIDASMDRLEKRYESDVKTGLDPYTTPDGATYDTQDMLEERRQGLYDQLDTMKDDPERLQKLYDFLRNSPEIANYTGIESENTTAPSTGLPEVSTQDFPILNEYPREIGVDQDSYNEALASILGDNLGPAPRQGEAVFTADNLTTGPAENPFETNFQGPEFDPYTGNIRYQNPGAGFTPQAEVNPWANTDIEPGSEYANALASIEDGNLDGRTTAGRYASAIGDKLKGSNAGNIIGGIATAAPALYNIGQGIFGKADSLNAEDFANIEGRAAARQLGNRRFNIDPQLAASRRAYATGRRNVSQAARTRGELLSNLGGLSTRAAETEAGIYANKQNIENQYLSEAAQMAANVGAQDAATRWQVGQYNKQAEAAQRGMLGTGLSQLSNLLQTRRRDKMLASNRTAADAQRMAALREMFPGTYS